MEEFSPFAPVCLFPPRLAVVCFSAFNATEFRGFCDTMAKTTSDKPGHHQVLQVELLARQRKRPQQSRSVALVVALKKAAREILESDGRQALTLQRLADYSGVAVSSIYEYFPALDALVNAVFVDYWEELLESLMAEVETLPPRASLYDGLLMLVQGLLDMQQQLIRMDPEVAEKYLQYGELRRLELVKSEDMPRSGVTQALMRRFPDEVSSANPDKLIFLALQTIQALFRIIVLEKPGYLTEKDTVVLLARTLHGLLTAPVDDERARG